MFDGEDENGGKIDAVMELVEQAFDAGRKVVIYTWHREFAYILLSRVNRRFKAPGGVVTGGMSFEEQYATANRINTDLQFVVGTIASMSTGLNLQGAQVVIFAETSYSPAENDQALKRVIRPGQEQPTWVYYLIAAGTVEEHIFQVTRERRSDTATIMKEYAAAVKHLQAG